MYKRLIALVSTVFIMFSTLTYAEENALYLSDNIIDMISGNADYQYNSASGFLGNLEILQGYEDVAYNRYADISRGDFAVLTARVFNLYVSSEGANNMFDDVATEHYASGAISALKSMNFISGDGNNCFRPDDPITLIEAVKMLCMGLGYNYYADTNGGYPNGYLSAATQADLLKNINISSNDKLTKNEAVLLIFNALHATIFQQTQHGAVSKIEAVPGESVLTKLHDVYYVDGIIKSNKITDISYPETSKDSIDIANMSLICDGVEVKQYLGYNARVYYKESNREQSVVYIMPKNTNMELKITDNDAEAEYVSDAKEIRYYEESGRLKRARLEDNFKLIYNNKSEGDYDSVLKDLEDSQIRLLDNDNNGYYDIVFITQYRNVVVKSINLDDEIVYDMYSPDNNWDWSNASSDAVINVTDDDGNAASLSDILPWRVLSISASNDGEYIDVVIVENFIYGTITGINEANKCFIDDREYRVAKNFADYGNQSLYVRLTGTFCLDVNGKIAAVVKEDDGAIKYGLFIKSWEDENEGIVYVKLYSQDGVLRTFECSKRVSNGSVSVKQEVLYNQISNINEQLIRYGVNSEGKLNRLEFASAEPDFNTAAEYNGFYQYKEEASRKYRKLAGTFNDDFLVNDQTLIFGIYPADEENEKYRRMEIANLTNDESYIISAYTDKTNPAFADVVCIMFEDDTENFDWCPFAVSKITTKINEDDEIINELNGYSADGAVIVETENESVLKSAGIAEGDVIRIKRNFNGKVNEVVKLYDSKTQSLVDIDNSSFNAKDGYHLIYPYAVSENTLKYTEGNIYNITKESQLKQKLMKYAVIVTESTQRGEVYTRGDLNNLITYTDDESNYSKVFMFSNYAEARLVVILNRE